MPETRNKTPFETAIIPGLDKDGADFATVVVRGTFDISKTSETPPIAEIQTPIRYAPEYYGEPGHSSLKYDADIALTKKSTDIVLIGHAWSPTGQQPYVDVGLRVGSLSRSIRVFGHRKWFRSLGMWYQSRPVPFEKLPLIYENAFGGIDQSDADSSKHSVEKRNPVGKGFYVSGEKDSLEGLLLPNLEDPRDLVKTWKDKPAPVGFGYIAPDWGPRMKYAGTYDDLWRETRLPFLPKDFNPQFFNSAHPDLISPAYLTGGEPVMITNASKTGNLSFRLPKRRISVAVWSKDVLSRYSPNLDTVVFEPDEGTMALIWRVAIPCYKKLPLIDLIQISEKE